jgi:hypothetical protein
MAKTLRSLKLTKTGTYRAQLVEMGPTREPQILHADDEPLVEVSLRMPLSDARRFGGMMYEWMELETSTACLTEDGHTFRPK